MTTTEAQTWGYRVKHNPERDADVCDECADRLLANDHETEEGERRWYESGRDPFLGQ